MSTPLTDALHDAHAQGFRDAARLIRDVAQRIADDHPEPEEAVTNILTYLRMNVITADYQEMP